MADIKTYKIGPEIFRLKDYGDLTGFEEEEITENDCFPKYRTKNPTLGEGQGMGLNITGYEIFPIILVTENPDVDVSSFDWRHLTNKQLVEILVDFAVEKKTSQDSMTDYMIKLTKQKMQQYGNSNQNMEDQKASKPIPTPSQKEGSMT